MDLLSVLDQRHRDQSSEARMAKNSFWCSLIWSFVFILLALSSAPVCHPKYEKTFFGTLLSLVFLMSMAGLYVSLLSAILSLSTARLPATYGSGNAGAGAHHTMTFLLPADSLRHRRFTYYGFYASFLLLILSGVSFHSFFVFLVALLLCIVFFVLHASPYYN